MNYQRVQQTWVRHEKIKNVRVHVAASSPVYDYTTTFRQSEEIVTYSGEFVVEIDIETIARDLAKKAANNSTGKSSYMGGLVKAKLCSKSEVKREKKEYPLPENTKLLDEEPKP